MSHLPAYSKLPAMLPPVDRLLPLLRRMAQTPLRIQALAVEPVLNHLFRQALRDRELAFLDGNVIVIRISDIGLTWPLTLRHGRLVLAAAGTPGHAAIQGESRAFAQLAARHTDPDTLFFQRRLSMAGDTELALMLKNWLDSLDFEALPGWLRFLLEQAAGNPQPA